MQVVRQGIEWGAAYVEAQPVRITHYGREILVFVNENHDLVVELPPGTTVSLGYTKAFSHVGGPCITAVVKG